MAVDFAYKLRNRSGKGWALRNIKLRMSRKLIYVSGLIACFLCHMDHTAAEWKELRKDPNGREIVIAYLENIFRQTPLDIMAGLLLRHDHLNNAALKIFGSYDEFLGILANGEQRSRLDALHEHQAETDDLYQTARTISHNFRDGLLTVFFDPQSGMEKLTQNYGVF